MNLKVGSMDFSFLLFDCFLILLIIVYLFFMQKCHLLLFFAHFKDLFPNLPPPSYILSDRNFWSNQFFIIISKYIDGVFSPMSISYNGELTTKDVGK